MRRQFLRIILAVLSPFLLPASGRADDGVQVSPPRMQGSFLIHEVESPYQDGRTQIRVLLPDVVAENEKLPTVYVLPVEAGNESRYGDGLQEVHAKNLHNTLRAAFVAPTFSQLPWYADHPTNSRIRQESYFLKVVIPTIEETYPVQSGASGRLLLGFSKSGWGAWSLLLRHPDKFARASAWDAPLMMASPGKYGSGPIFGTQANFDAYCLAALIPKQAGNLKAGPRLLMTGAANFRSEHLQMHQLLERLGIPHVDRDGPPREHNWQSGWVEESVRMLLNAPGE